MSHTCMTQGYIMAKGEPSQYPACDTLSPTHTSQILIVPTYTELRHENQHPEIL